MTAHADPDNYDAIPFDSMPFRATSPDNLAAIATLHGLDPPAVPTCRVLELGTASGGNLLPLAASFPQAQFVGVDLSARRIEVGQATLAAAGLTNVELIAASVLDLGEDLGPFDYVIAHGIYSWVPPAVQQQILDLVQRLLTPCGVACISYNTYPGWHLRGILRDLANYHTRRIAEPRHRLEETRAFLDFFVRSLPDPSTPFAQMIEDEVEQLRDGRDTYVFHEHLERFNEPLYFHQFAARAAGAGLQYVAEARFDDRLDDFPEEVRTTLASLSANVIELEQYVDFLVRRTFRETVLAHSAAPVCHPVDLTRCQQLHFSALVHISESPPPANSPDVTEFVISEGVTLTTNDPLAKAALEALAEVAPRSLAFDELRRMVLVRLGAVEGVELRLGELLLRCVRAKAVMVQGTPLPAVRTAGARPRATALARHQARQGERIVTLHHLVADLTPFERTLLMFADGAHDRKGLIEEMSARVAGGSLQLQHDGLPVEGANAITAVVEEALDPALERIARQALLLG